MFINPISLIALIEKLLFIFLLTLIPFLELRLSIPIGVFSGKIELPFGLMVEGFGLPILPVFLTAVTANILLGPMVYFFYDKVIHFFLHFKWINSLYNRIVLRTQRKSKKLIERFGLIGLIFFIAVPLPGSGSYTAALAAYLLGIGYKKFALINAFGVIIAGLLVSLISLGFFA